MVAHNANLANGAVHNANIANGAVTGDKVAARTLTGANVKRNSLTGREIKESTLRSTHVVKRITAGPAALTFPGPDPIPLDGGASSSFTQPAFSMMHYEATFSVDFPANCGPIAVVNVNVDGVTIDTG